MRGRVDRVGVCVQNVDVEVVAVEHFDSFRIISIHFLPGNF